MAASDALLALVEEAVKAAGHAYAPYSEFRVGAALVTETGKTFAAANVENASYGLTICAERAAIAAAVAADGPRMRIKAIAVATADGRPAAPCGACRQVIWEFGPNATVVFGGESGETITTAAALLPHAFELAEDP